MDPSNQSIYYWGSSYGKIYKSTDSGSTWAAITNAGNGTINKILIHPTNSNIVFASSHNIWDKSNGIFKSTNGGSTWTQVAIDAKSFDIEFNSNDPNIVYASGEYFHISNNMGDSFNTIGGFSTGAKMIGVTKADSNRVYVLEEVQIGSSHNGKFGGFYVSTNGGNSFVKKTHLTKNYLGYETTGNGERGQAPRDMDIAVSPSNKDEVHIAGIITWRSVDGGESFSPTSDWVPKKAINKNLGYCHADVDLLEFIGNTLYTCTDGGVFLAENTANINTNYYRDITTGLGIRAFYRIGISQTSPVVIAGGSQDCGTSFYSKDKGWNEWLGSDGIEAFVDKTDSNILYATSTGGTLYKTTNQGTSYKSIPSPEKYGNWAVPFEQDPIAVNTIYSGYKAVYKSSDGGGSWKQISQKFENLLEHLKIAPSNSNVRLYSIIRLN